MITSGNRIVSGGSVAFGSNGAARPYQAYTAPVSTSCTALPVSYASIKPAVTAPATLPSSYSIGRPIAATPRTAPFTMSAAPTVVGYSSRRTESYQATTAPTYYTAPTIAAPTVSSAPIRYLEPIRIPYQVNSGQQATIYTAPTIVAPTVSAAPIRYLEPSPVQQQAASVPPQIFGMRVSGNVMPILVLLEENGIPYDFVETNVLAGEQMTPEFLAMNPLHTVPVFKNEELTMYESGAILRYICNKYKLEQWYPSSAQARALCDMMLDVRQTSMMKNVFDVWFYPRVGFAAPKTVEEEQESMAKFEQEIWPSFQQVFSQTGGPFLGGPTPNIADLSIFGYLAPTCWRTPDWPGLAVPGVQEYIEALQNAITTFDSSVGPAAAFWPDFFAGAPEDQAQEQVDENAPAGAETVSLSVTIVRGDNLKDADWVGKSDPYCICQIPGIDDSKVQTQVINNNSNPEWNETFIIPGYVVGDSIHFAVYDKDVWPKSDDFIGEITLDGANVSNSFEGSLDLSVQGSIYVVVEPFVA